MNKITAIIVTYNEEKNIEECLKSIDFADEILIVDSNSSDKTKEIAKNFPVKIIDTDINYPEEKKNMGMGNALNPWVLILDADERISPELKEEIIDTLKEPKEDGYWIYRRNYFLGKEIKHCGWERDKVIRLFKKDTGRYPDQRVHGQLEFTGSTGKLKNKIIHYTYRNISDYFKKVDKYTGWSAKDLKGKKVNSAKLFFNPLSRFIKMYFLRLGFLDGVGGFALCVTASFSVFIKYLRIYLQEN
jgi:glycosyltransferase involved in cell wall biosynthesis